MHAFFELLQHFYAIVRHVGGLHWFRGVDIQSVAAARDRFFSDLSHEFQTPITILKSNVEIAMGRRGGDRELAIAAIGATTDRMEEMVGGYLAAARLDAPEYELRKEEFLLGDLLDGVSDDCATLAEDRGVSLVRGNATAAHITADREKLRRALLNLMSNALKHTEPGGEIRLSGRVTADGASGWVEIAVCDTGHGIAAEELPHIFERFYRAAGDETCGTGLGLYIVKKIAEAHGGRIVAESEIGRGSLFTVRIPL